MRMQRASLGAKWAVGRCTGARGDVVARDGWVEVARREAREAREVVDDRLRLGHKRGRVRGRRGAKTIKGERGYDDRLRQGHKRGRASERG
eukprot:619602-Prymnesium_polylepis.1